MFSRRSVLASTAASSIAFRAMARSGEAGNTITYGQSTPLLTMDPAHGGFTSYSAGNEAALCLYDRILDFDEHMNIVPGIAESWSIADDLRSATLKLRPGVTFHDGTVCDAAAVRFNLARLMDRHRTTVSRAMWDPLAGAEATDARTVRITLKAPFSQLPNTLAHGSAAVVSPAAIAKYGETGIAQNPVGAGPFKLVEFDPGRQLVAEAFVDYWGGKPGTDRIIFRTIAGAEARVSALRDGSVDVIDSVPVSLVGPLQSDPNISVIAVTGLRPYGCIINFSHQTMKNVRIRQALNLAVPVAAITDKMLQGFARAPDSPLAFDTEGYHSVAKLTYDPARAKTLLTEMGYGGASRLGLVFNVPAGVFQNDEAVAEIVANALREVGIDVRVDKVGWTAYWQGLRQDLANLTWDIALFAFNPSNASGLYHLNSVFRSNVSDAGPPDAWNIGRYRNPEVDALLIRANETPDREKQNALLGQAQEIIWKDAPYIWLQIDEIISAARKTVKGVEVWPVLFTNVRRATG